MIARQKLAVAEPRGTTRGWAKDKRNTTDHLEKDKIAPMHVGEMLQRQSLLLPNDREKLTTIKHPLMLAHLTPIHLSVENYLIFFVFLPKNIAHNRLGIIFAYLRG